MPHTDDRFQLGDFWLSQNRVGTWCRTCFDPDTRQTRRTSLGTTDFERAKRALAEWYIKHADIKDAEPADVPVATVLERYAAQRGNALPSADTVKRAVALWGEFWGTDTVAEMSIARQEAFSNWLRDRELSDAYVRRLLGVGKAALNRAYKRQEITHVPYVVLPPEGEPYEHWATNDQIAVFLNAVPPDSHLWTYCLIRLNTGCRGDAARELTPRQVDFATNVLRLNPPGRKQTKKRRPVVPLTNTLRNALAGNDLPEVPYVNWHGNKINSIRRAWRETRAQTNLPSWFIPKVLRHTVATELRRRGVPGWEVSGLLGHTKGESAETTSRYAKFAPDFMAASRNALDSWMVELAAQVPRLEPLTRVTRT